MGYKLPIEKWNRLQLRKARKESGGHSGCLKHGEKERRILWAKYDESTDSMVMHHATKGLRRKNSMTLRIAGEQRLKGQLQVMMLQAYQR